MAERYRTYSSFLKSKYGEKVYKLPVNLPVTCPNRDGRLGIGGCIFCGEEEAGFETLPDSLSVKEQLTHNMEYIGLRYGAKKFIVYFQNYTNTYMPIKLFKECVWEGCMEGVVGISVSTRPDCISGDYLEVLQEVSREKNVDIYIEMGLQTVNYHTLKRVNRGHGLAEFIDGVLQVRDFGFNICTHLILNLPWDDMEDIKESAKVISALKVDQVKLHALYVLENTSLGQMYKRGEISMISKEEYVERVILFLEFLDPQIVVQRMIGRAPQENALFVNWGTSWWKIRDEIEGEMEKRDTFQGKNYNYLGGKAVRR